MPIAIVARLQLTGKVVFTDLQLCESLRKKFGRRACCSAVLATQRRIFQQSCCVKKSRQRIAGNLNNATVRRVSGLWHHDWDSFVEVMMEWWVIAVELGVPVIIGLAIYLTLRK